MWPTDLTKHNADNSHGRKCSLNYKLHISIRQLHKNAYIFAASLKRYRNVVKLTGKQKRHSDTKLCTEEEWTPVTVWPRQLQCDHVTDGHKLSTDTKHTSQTGHDTSSTAGVHDTLRLRLKDDLKGELNVNIKR